ncbi:MAG: PD-(D/E)XK nuclease family protein [Armatimonadota bacterium]
MGIVTLWLGPAGGGKTGKALAILREELDRGWQGVRYLVPTVGHKQSIEHLLCGQDGRHGFCGQDGHHGFTGRDDRRGLIGDPLTTFFNFAEEVALRARLGGKRLSELQKHLILKKLARETPVKFFDKARRFPGFVLALGEAIDELKVQMIEPERLLIAAGAAAEHDAAGIEEKLRELGTLYAGYQSLVYRENLYDNEGIMWTAAEQLRGNPDLCGDLRCLILDGFARLTPIQVEFLSALAPRVERIFVLFDYEEGRTATYHPVLDSLGMLEREADKRQFIVKREDFLRLPRSRSSLECLRDEIFRERKHTCPPDRSLRMVIAATPAQEAEAIAREIRRLLRDGLDGARVTPADIAILARNADAVYERLARTCRRFGVEVVAEPPALAHTPVGRAVLASLRLVRDGWKREDLLSLLKSGFLPIEQAVAFEIDLAARTRYLRDRKSTWLERWPEEENAEALRVALAPLAAFDEAFHHAGVEDLLDALNALLNAFEQNAVPAQPPLPDEQPAEAERYVALTASFTLAKAVVEDLRGLNRLLRGFRREELIELVTSALVRAQLPARAAGGIPILSAHTTGGQKFKVVFLCNLLQGVFPRHQRESSFLLDHEREESLPGLNIRMDARRHLEEDERFWFLHALSSATQRIVLSYPEHDANGAELERSYFIDEVLKIVPELPAARTSFSDVAPPLHDAAHSAEWMSRLAVELRNEREPAAQPKLAAAYHANLPAYGRPLSALFRRAGRNEAALAAAEVLRQLAERARPFSASELQSYLDCPFSWFAGACLGVEVVSEEYGMLDRGLVAHAALERLYRRQQRRHGEPVHLERFTLEDLWPEVEADLREQLEGEPRFVNRPAFWKDIEWESLARTMRRFLQREIERAGERGTHPAYFERHFGSGQRDPLELCGGALRLRGTIDRIDLADDDPELAIVVDYKSSASMSMKDLEAGKVLQAPIYALALARLLEFTPIGVEFMGIKQAEAKGIYRQEAKDRYPAGRGMKLLSPETWQSLLDHCESTLGAAAARITTGDIDLAPTTPRCPLRCDYYALCRGSRAELEKRVREAKEENG